MITPHTSIVQTTLGSLPWSPWTPVYTPDSGEFTKVTTNDTGYLVVGKLVTWYLDMSINTLGTASGGFNFTMPPGLVPILDAPAMAMTSTNGTLQMITLTTGVTIVRRVDGVGIVLSSLRVRGQGRYSIE